jgi:hypothetical protein
MYQTGSHWTNLREILYWDFLWKHLSTKSKFGYGLVKISGTLDEELGTFLLLPETLNRHKRALLERNGVRLLG